MSREQTTRKQGRELQVGDRVVWDGQTRVIAGIGPGFVPATLDVAFP